MSSQIILVHDDEAFRDAALAALRADKYTVVWYPDAVAAATALAEGTLAELLITRVRFAAGRSNGANLALMFQTRYPHARVIFVAAPETHEHVSELGIFLPMPVAIPDLLKAVAQELGTRSGAPAEGH